jgi:hypothetical protein
MQDERIWDFERSLWTGPGGHYRELIDDEALLVVPAPPFILGGSAAAEMMAQTPRWERVDFSQQQVKRPQDGLIVIAYTARASREGHDPYEAHCTTVMRRIEHDVWRVVQHQQTPPLTAPAAQS